MLKDAFKEWAVICKALAEGKQALILRKGGIAEEGGEFRVEHTRFWLFPTYVHQQSTGVKPEALPLLQQAEAERPPAGIIRLTHYAEVAGVYHLHDMVGALRIRLLHLWSDETVYARFQYRTPGLFVMPVRVFRAAQVFDLPETPYYAGCRSWVELERELPTGGATPVLSDAAFKDVMRELDTLLNPTANA
ncbi:MAG TPA: DUF1802 family protein [Gemmataceae bacterium]|jgi:hypothetical protein|nr:DUF1802 family protein [Gemmataceae bacterium]